MAKRKITAGGNDAVKRRRRSIISDPLRNPQDERGLAQCFRVTAATAYVSLAPAFALEPRTGIQRVHLDPLIMSHSVELGGIVLAHFGLELLGQDEDAAAAEPGKPQPPAVARVMNDSPFSFLWIRSQFLVWSPRKADYIAGWVSVQSPSHIALLVHDTFNATIKREDIPETWRFEAFEADAGDGKSLGYWLDSEGNRVGGKLHFTVKQFNVAGRTALIQGSLLTTRDVKLPTIPADDKAEATESLAGTDAVAASDAAADTAASDTVVDDTVPEYAATSESESESESETGSGSGSGNGSNSE